MPLIGGMNMVRSFFLKLCVKMCPAENNYKDYYYLPQEDTAIHKSIASFVDKAYREQAKPENCYTKKEGQYLMEWDLVFAPFFKESYNDKRFFFDLNENVKKSRFAMSLYACHVISHILDMS